MYSYIQRRIASHDLVNSLLNAKRCIVAEGGVAEIMSIDQVLQEAVLRKYDFKGRSMEVRTSFMCFRTLPPFDMIF